MEQYPTNPAAPPPIMPGMTTDTDAVIGPLIRSTGWLKLLGVMSIIGGVLTALSCYGIVIAWLPIWLGVLQWQAADRLAVGHGAGDMNVLAHGTEKLRLAFKIQGITLIVVTAIYVVLFLVLGLGMIAALLGGAGGP